MSPYRLVTWFAIAVGLLGSFSFGCRRIDSLAHVPRSVTGIFHRRPADSDLAALPDDSGQSAKIPVALTDDQATADRPGSNQLATLTKATLASWSILTDDQLSDAVRAEAWQSYHRELKALLGHLIKTDQLDPTQPIVVTAPDQSQKFIRIQLHGFAWKADDLNRFEFATGKKHTQTKHHSALARYWQQPGLGIPLVALRIRERAEPYHGQVVPFSATAILRPVSSHRIAQVSHRSEMAILELYDPLSSFQARLGNQDHQLCRDLSAPLAHAVSDTHRSKIQDFMTPEHQHEGVGLRMLEPYQAGKIPVVFIHGLLSDRLTWIDLINDLRVTPWFNDRYQVWSYQYPTGQSYLRSGAELRAALRQAIHDVDPEKTDPALSAMVLIGHSMGGLLTKLQICSSDSSIWDSIATRPVAHLTAPNSVKQTINAMFFFEPQPFVSRAIFIGTPNLGSDWASSLIGQFSSSLVHQPKDRLLALHDLIKNNPHIFVEQIHDRLPTSIDLLRPDSPLLMATYPLPVADHVTTHSIIGTGKPLKDSIPADGVVSVKNAKHPQTVSEQHIETTHTHLPDHPQTTEEVTRILSEHLLRFDAS